MDKKRKLRGACEDWIAKHALAALVHQIELGDFTDAVGHKLTNNVHFIAAKKAVESSQ